MDKVINGERFSAADASISFLGKVTEGVVEINYSETQEVEPVYVVGNRESAGFTRGKHAYKGDITLLHEDALALNILGKGSVTRLKPFPITITKIKNGLIIKETLTNVVFTGDDNAINGGSTGALQNKLSFWFSNKLLV